MNRNEAIELLKKIISNTDLVNGNPIKDNYRHAYNVAYVAESIAKCVDLDSDKAYIMGLLHDVGRAQDRKIRHSILGYKLLKSYGVSEEIARITITHLFILKDGSNLTNQFIDFKDDELKFVQNYLKNIEYDDYDKLLQISDLIGGATIMTIEERIFSVFCRYNQINNMSFCQQIKNLKEYFESKMGTSIYEPLKNMMGKVVNYEE